MFNVATDAITWFIHPTEIFNSMNLLQMPCMITQNKNQCPILNLAMKIAKFKVRKCLIPFNCRDI